MKYLIALLSLVTLTACVGDGNTAPTVTDIQGSNLTYGLRAEFQFFGSYLDKGLSATVQNCSAATPTFISPTHQVLQCTINAVGELKVEVRDGGGAVIFSKAFTVLPPRVVLITSMGNIVVELDPTRAPVTVNNFLAYVLNRFYAGTIFHRVIAGFVVQGGGFTTGLVTAPGALAPISLESNSGLKNLRGTIAMARTPAPNSATSQFYFNLVDNPTLDYKDSANPGYAVFGNVVQGAEIMDAIGASPTSTVNAFADVPVTDVVLRATLRIQ